MNGLSNRLFTCRKTLKVSGLTALACSLWLLPLSSLQATMLDDFNGTKTGWTDFLIGGGSVNQAGGTFTVVSGSGANALAYSKKTSAAFTIAAGHSLEFRANVNGIAPGGAANGHAILGWAPSASTLTTSSYYMSVGVQDVQIKKGATTLYSTNLDTALSTTNLVMALRITPNGTSLSITASVYNQLPGTTNLMFEYTATDASGLIGQAGNAVLGAENRPSGSAASVVFDNLEVFDTVYSVVDNFDAARTPCAPCGGQVHNNWFDYAPAGAIMTTPGQLQMAAVTYQDSITLTATYFLGQTFRIVEGARIEFSIDVLQGINDPNAAILLCYFPNGAPDLGSLAVYYVGQSSALIAAGKNAVQAWVPQLPISLKYNNVRLIQTMTGEPGGTSVRLEQRIEDLDAQVNDPARILFQTVYVDSAQAYTNKSGYYGLIIYHDKDAFDVATLLDNATVNQTIPGNSPPIITSVNPPDGKNFLASSSPISFTVMDDVNTTNIVLMLNGVRYTNGSPGVTITGANQSKVFTFAGPLSANVFYSGSIQATDDQGATSEMHYEFDTFLASNPVVECEEFNFSLDPITGIGGAYIDNPELLPVNGQMSPTAYNGNSGIPEIDFHDNRTTGGFFTGQDHVFRPDPPRNNKTQDPARAKYVNAGGTGGGFSEIGMSDLANGDWINYTHHYPAGTYNVYMRCSTYRMPYSLATLERVVDDATSNTNQSTAVLGSFVQKGDAAGDTGFDIHRVVPLTDAAGNLAIVKFDGGIQTLRVNDVFVNYQGSDVFQNYMVLVPVADPGTLRPVVGTAFPAPKSTFRQSAMPETTYAMIGNRDTTVDTNSIVLAINGTTVPITVKPGPGGAQVSWSLANVPATPVITNSLNYKDSQGTNLSYSWTYSYPLLEAKNSLPVGSLTVRGWQYRLAQAYNNGASLGDSLIRAEQQLSGAIPSDISFSNIVQTLDWVDYYNGVPGTIPGLDPNMSYDNIAVEALGYVHLTKGLHRFRVNSDDGFEIRSGATPGGTEAVVLGSIDGDTFGGTFDFAVEVEGLYPIRALWYDNTGQASFHVYSVKLDSNTDVLLNDPADPAGVAKVYFPGTPTTVQVATSLDGNYTTAVGAVVDQVAKTVTVPMSGSMLFYRMLAPTPVTLKVLRIAGGNLVIGYQ